MTGRRIESNIREFIAKYEQLRKLSDTKGKVGRFQVDPKKRKAIESAAVNYVWDHFETELEYKLKDHQKDNLGYDLVAENGVETLCVEVKGRSGKDIIADFSPNEYNAIMLEEKGRHKDGSYRICIVTNALHNPRLHHFMYWPSDAGKNGGWWTVDGKYPLQLKQVSAARGSAKIE